MVQKSQAYRKGSIKIWHKTCKMFKILHIFKLKKCAFIFVVCCIVDVCPICIFLLVNLDAELSLNHYFFLLLLFKYKRLFTAGASLHFSANFSIPFSSSSHPLDLSSLWIHQRCPSKSFWLLPFLCPPKLYSIIT